MVTLSSLFRRKASQRPSSSGRDSPRLPPSNGDWTRHRAPRRSQDETLSAACVAWLGGLPCTLQPANLCFKYPAVANRIALCWSDPALMERVFDDLLLDRRGRRRGFPSEVASDLLRLRLFHARSLRGEGDSPWDLQALATSDR